MTHGVAHRAGRAAVAVAALIAAAGCASIPVDGPVQAGAGQPAADGDIFPIPPQIPEGDPSRLVDGFLTASAAGVAGDFAGVRDYLTGPVAGTWDPTAQVTIYGTGEFAPVWDKAAQTVTYSLPVAATVDADGRMTEAATGTRTTVVFGMTSVLPGRWRISSLEDGIVMSEASFALVYRPVALAFRARDADVIVPDLRWLPRRNIATHATQALLGGPSPWLADAVSTGLSPTAQLSVGAVPIDGGQATVSLAPGSAGSAADRALALSQFSTTLTEIPDIASVAVTVGGLPIGGDGSVRLTEAPVPSSRAAVIADGRLGVWDGQNLLVPAEGGLVPSGARGLALAYDGSTVAMIVGAGTLVTASMPPSLVPIGQAGAPVSPVATTTVLVGTDLVAPSFDREGWVWTAEAGGEGVLQAIGPDGTLVDLPVRGIEGRDIGAIAVAHDGARVAIVSREGGVWRLGVAAIVRSEDGTPLSIGSPLDVGVGISQSEAVAWVDDRVVAVLGSSADGQAGTVRMATVGGRTDVVATVPDAVGLAARTGVGSVALVAKDGSLYVRVNTVWSKVVTGATIAELAFSG